MLIAMLLWNITGNIFYKNLFLKNAFETKKNLFFVFYSLNLDPEHNPYFPKKKVEEAEKFVIYA